MTNQRSDIGTDAVINEALSVIDGALANMMKRELMSSVEVADLLLDVRTLLTTDHDGAEGASDIEPVTSDAV